MIGRIAWFAALLLVAMVTIAVQVDRQSARDPKLAGLVPTPFRAFAQTHLAAAAADSGDVERALEEARLLVRRRPGPAEHLTLLAVAQTNAGLPEQAGLTIQVAGQRGWREPLSQEAVLRLALAAGDQPEAARRYAALLLRSATPDALLQELGEQVLGEPEGPGRQTIIDIVSAAERWQTTFLRRGIAVISYDAFAEIVAGSSAQGAAFDCTALKQAAKTLAQRDAEAARKLGPALDTCRRN